jgi:predicted neutral ceramidase superfamily lipid hydrolase
MALKQNQWGRNELARAGLFVVASTVALTASFLGVVGLLTGAVTGLNDRLPVYVLAMALSFVVVIVALEEEYREPVESLQLSASIAAVTFLLVTFGGEGIAYLLQNSEQVVASQILFYILAAGLIGTGLGYWTLNHWSEFAGNRASI